MYKVSKIIVDGLELLPDFIDTPIWEDFNEGNCDRRVKMALALYQAVLKRENYFQLNSPTAFGNPEYNYCCGLVNGFLQAIDGEEERGDKNIIFRSNKKILLMVDAVKRPKSYYVSRSENNETMRSLGLL